MESERESPNVKTLSLGDLIFDRRGSFVLRAMHVVFGTAAKIFFRRIELVNTQNIVPGSSVIFVLNHPNGLIDPLLLFTSLPRKVSFLAKSTIFKMPVLGWLAKAAEALPVYRQKDGAHDPEKNKETFRLCRDRLKKGGAIAIFPEGVSHSEPRLLPLKTGAARIALGAMSVGQNPDAVHLSIVPVGLFYTSKTTFRSEVLLTFGKPFRVMPVELEADAEPPKEAVTDLTKQIEDALRYVTINAESLDEMETATRAEEVYSSVYESAGEKQTLADRFEFLQQFADLNIEGTEEAEKLERRLEKYQKKLNKLGIDPEHLALPEYSRWFAIKFAFKKLGLLALAAPLAIIGTVLHYPAYLLCHILAKKYGSNDSADIASTIKILAGLALMPLTWGILAFVLSRYYGWGIGLASVPVAFICGYVALKTFEELQELRRWLNVTFFFVAKRDKFFKLFAERKRLHKELKKFD